jgi:hypothetical protein
MPVLLVRKYTRERLENHQECLKIGEKVQEILAIGSGRSRDYRENLTKIVPGSGTDKNP